MLLHHTGGFATNTHNRHKHKESWPASSSKTRIWSSPWWLLLMCWCLISVQVSKCHNVQVTPITVSTTPHSLPSPDSARLNPAPGRCKQTRRAQPIRARAGLCGPMRGRDMVVQTNSRPSCAGDCVAEAEERCYGCYQIVRSECFPKMFCQDPFCDIPDPRSWLLQNNCRIYQLHPAARLLIIEWNWKGSASIDYRNVRGQSPVLGGVHVIVQWPPPSPHTSSPRTMDSWTAADLRQDSALTKRWLRQSSAP